ncbi:hypothetical protein SHELI_v1c11500 [Spiroplasma helicoides]|uniref:Uncharacterized protein n=1 Tax=Spiroplasma helicoides TaxID=216938 RepID=A0A1B3SMF7_9MOLU|nr:hypothetical protein [Spiroplasma helicoides]AOG61097.1 hypothetical protein SHELI_v1c11500 [Spiroplasma helicoides]
MSQNKKYMVRMIYSGVVWLLITIVILAIGFSYTDKNASATQIFKGWGKADPVISDDSKNVTTGFGYLQEHVFSKDTKGQLSGLTKGMYNLSLSSFVFSLLYFLWNVVFYGISFKKEDVIKDKAQFILDIVFTVIIALTAVLFLASMGSLVNDLNKTYKDSSLPEEMKPGYKLSTNYIISAALISLGLVGHVVGVTLLQTKLK